MYIHTYRAIMVTMIRIGKDSLIRQEILSMSIYLAPGIIITCYTRGNREREIRVIRKSFYKLNLIYPQ